MKVLELGILDIRGEEFVYIERRIDNFLKTNLDLKKLEEIDLRIKLNTYLEVGTLAVRSFYFKEVYL